MYKSVSCGMLIVEGNEHGNLSSNTRRGCLYFTEPSYTWGRYAFNYFLSCPLSVEVYVLGCNIGVSKLEPALGNAMNTLIPPAIGLVGSGINKT